MAKLILSSNGNLLGNYFLDKERFSIGRKPENDLQIDDPSISKEHAVISTVGNDQILEDKGSTNGTVVNGERVTRRILQNGDVIELSRYQLKYVNQKASADMDFDRTMMIPALNADTRRDDAGSPSSGQVSTAASTARTATASFPLASVRGLAGAHAGQNIELDRPLATFGRPGVQVAMITRRPHGYFVTHVQGEKHPVVNGRAVGAEAHPLKDRDIIDVGGEKLEFSLKA